MRQAGMKVDQPAPIADPQELADYDGIIFGTPTRFGNMSSQMRNFLDQTGPLWVSGALIGKVGSVFTSTSTGGGNETTIVSFHWTLLHHGMIVVGLPYSAPDLADISEVQRRLALRRRHHRRARRLAPALAEGAQPRELPGPSRGQDRQDASPQSQ